MHEDAYEVLQLDRSATETEIRQAYLAMVRAHSPERDAEGFARVRNAYEQLQDPLQRLRRQLFETDTSDSLAAVEEAVRRRVWTKRIPTESLLRLAEQT